MAAVEAEQELVAEQVEVAAEEVEVEAEEGEVVEVVEVEVVEVEVEEVAERQRESFLSWTSGSSNGIRSRRRS